MDPEQRRQQWFVDFLLLFLCALLPVPLVVVVVVARPIAYRTTINITIGLHSIFFSFSFYCLQQTPVMIYAPTTTTKTTLEGHQEKWSKKNTRRELIDCCVSLSFIDCDLLSRTRNKKPSSWMLLLLLSLLFYRLLLGSSRRKDYLGRASSSSSSFAAEPLLSLASSAGVFDGASGSFIMISLGAGRA